MSSNKSFAEEYDAFADHGPDFDPAAVPDDDYEIEYDPAAVPDDEGENLDEPRTIDVLMDILAVMEEIRDDFHAIRNHLGGAR